MEGTETISKSNNKSLYLKVFNNQFQELLDDINRIIPNNVDIITMQNALSSFKKTNPKLIISMWNNYVVIPYGNQINSGNYEFFIDKDYGSDFKGHKNEKVILDGIDRMREVVRALDENNKKHSLDYIKNLCSLSNLYFTN